MLIDSIKEVEALFIQSVLERNRLAYKFSDNHPETIAMNHYINEIALLLQRTSIYYYDSILNSALSHNYEDFKKTIEIDIKNIKKDIEFFGENNSMELENYFAGKLKIARCFKNLFSESVRTFKINDKKYEQLCALYDFGYIKGTQEPYCPVLPDLGQLSIHEWDKGYVQYLNEEDEGKPLHNINPADYIPVLPPKPITSESLEFDAESFYKKRNEIITEDDGFIVSNDEPFSLPRTPKKEYLFEDYKDLFDENPPKIAEENKTSEYFEEDDDDYYFIQVEEDQKQ